MANTEANKKPRRETKKGISLKINKKTIIIALSAVVVLALGISIAILSGPLSTLKEGRIHAGIFLGPVDVSDLTEEEAEKKVLDYITEYEEGKIGFKISQQEKDYSANELKIQWTDKEVIKEAMKVGREGSIFERYGVLKELENTTRRFEIKLSYDDGAIDSMLKDLASEYNEEAVEPTIKRANGSFVINEGHEGIVLDQEASKTAIAEYFGGRWNVEDRMVELVATIQKPKGSVEELSKIKDTLGTFSTATGTGARVTNIANGASKINGSVVYPGEEFSANAAMEPYTAKAGYVNGGTFENGTVVQSMGGGICQVSSTLYNAALLAELEITQRAPHSMMVGYVEPSMDAAIAGTWKDLKFKNNTGAPIYIEGGASGGKLFFTIYGQETRSASRTIKYVSETLSETDPGISVKEDASYPVGFFAKQQDAHVGLSAKLWKVVYENGKEVSRTEVNSSSYSATPDIYVMGIGGATEDQLSKLRAAVATGDADQCYSVAGSINEKPAEPAPTPSSSPAPSQEPKKPGSEG